MAQRAPASPPNNAGDPPQASDFLEDFNFTFNVSSISLGKNSVIEPDPNFDVSDNSSESLSESVQNYPEEFGRTYHAYRAGSYAFPNDVPERERLQLQDQIITALFGGRLFFSPFTEDNPPRLVLDIATGTGSWAIQMGDQFPSSEIIATDLSPIQPGEVPPNVNFYVEDSSEPWDYTDRFDFIHTRVTSGCWSSFKTQIAEQAYETLNPGGWLESHEFDAHFGCDDGTLREDAAMRNWARDMTTAGDRVDRPVVMAAHLKRIYEEVGFTDVQQRVFKVPTNGWAKDEKLKELGRAWEVNFQLGFSGFTCAMYNRAFGRSVAETEVSLINVRRELSDSRIHAYVLIYAVWGRKPFPGEEPVQRQSSDS